MVNVNPGDIVVTTFGLYQHWSIVSDCKDDDGQYMLISATKRTGTVREESWDKTTEGKSTYVANVQGKCPLEQLLENARAQIGTWRYSLVDHNCEHFVKWASKITVSSTQVIATAGGVFVGSIAAGMIAEKPTFLKFLSGGVLVGALAILLVHVKKKQSLS